MVWAKYREPGTGSGPGPEQEEDSGSYLMLSPLVTVWTKGRYYVLGTESTDDELHHYRIDRLSEIRLTEEPSEVVFGGLNPRDYIERNILKRTAPRTEAVLQCRADRWGTLCDSFSEARVLSRENDTLTVRVRAYETDVIDFCMSHLQEFELIRPNSARDKIKALIAEGFGKYIG